MIQTYMITYKVIQEGYERKEGYYTKTFKSKGRYKLKTPIIKLKDLFKTIKEDTGYNKDFVIFKNIQKINI